jgi:hypothetical protein
MMDEKDNTSTRLSHLLDVWRDLLDPVTSFYWNQNFCCHCLALPLISLGRNRCAKREGWLVRDARWQFIEFFDSISLLIMARRIIKR